MNGLETGLIGLAGGVISAIGVAIGGLVYVVKSVLPKLLEKNAQPMQNNGLAKRQEVVLLGEKVNEHWQNQNRHCFDQTEKCNQRFEDLAVAVAEMKGVPAELAEIKRDVKTLMLRGG